MTFYELIFLRQFPMKLLGLPTTKHFLSFILGCPQDLHFARPFWYGWVETGLNGRNSLAKLKSCAQQDQIKSLGKVNHHQHVIYE